MAGISTALHIVLVPFDWVFEMYIVFYINVLSEDPLNIFFLLERVEKLEKNTRHTCFRQL